MINANMLAKYRDDTAKMQFYTVPKVQHCPGCKKRRSIHQFSGRHLCNQCRGGK